MEFPEYLRELDTDFQRLRAVVAGHLAQPVPSCPEWTGEQLVRHVAEVYLHKSECMRRNDFPRPWPPDLSGEEPMALLDRAYAELAGEFAARTPDAPAATWYEPEQTAGFWARRMAQETVIHRIDAELTAGAPVQPISAELAVDGVDEVLTRFLDYGSHRWQEDFVRSIPDTSQPPVLVRTPGRGWLVRATPDGVLVEPAHPGAAAPATVTGPPTPLLLWLWNRGGADEVTVAGDEQLVAGMRALLVDATQ